VLFNNGVTFGVEGDRPDGAPVTRMACPACRVVRLRLGVQRMSGGQNDMVFAGTLLTLAKIYRQVFKRGLRYNGPTIFDEFDQPIFGHGMHGA